ncbi:ABC transporter permease [Virgisporangium aurantiacum]|uniref:Transport permease protein n=1 Tax=Virgisporangium aurantiacum TaxID=175570 RepID=A0A8J3YZ25_9ACTN|nr:ABC transporter permease [Virgisporangium aurantiacum]GIJ53167.1 transport permease protein [Virgisporangium aurantiacum]
MTTTLENRVAVDRRPNALRLGIRRGGLEIRQFLRSRESVVFTLAFPVMLLVIFGSVFDDNEVADGVPFTQYFVAGMIAAGLLTVGFQNLAIMIPIERDRGALKRLRGTPMPPTAFFLGKVLMVLAIGAAETVLLLVMAFTLYDVPVPGPAQWVTFLWVSVLGITACTLCGVAFSSLVRSGRGAPAMVTPVALGLQFISGVFSLFTNLPPWMQQLAALFPLKWMTQGMRAVFLPPSFAAHEPAGSSELGLVALVLVLWCVGALVVSRLTFRWTSRD